MSVYSLKGKGWRYDFILKGTRHTEAWFKTKTEAKRAEARRREEIEKQSNEMGNPTDIDFLELVNARLDHVRAYQSEEHYRTHVYLARRWVKKWGDLPCAAISHQMIQDHILERRKISAYTANKDLRYLRATFNHGLKKKLINSNPTERVEFLPEEKKVKEIPTPEDIDKVIAVADLDTQDYLWTIRETMGRVGEINQLKWNDVNLKKRYVILYTRKKKGGHRTPRKVPMTEKLFEVLSRRSKERDESKPWVFWIRYWSRKEKKFKVGPYGDRKKIMKSLCKKAGVKYFRFHPLRHAGASVMDESNVPIGDIQRILGHENRRTTEIYLHSIGDSERRAIMVYEDARKKSHTESHMAPDSDKRKGVIPDEITPFLY